MTTSTQLLRAIALLSTLSLTQTACATGPGISTEIVGDNGEYIFTDHGQGRTHLEGYGSQQRASIYKSGSSTLDVFMSGDRSDLNITDNSTHGLSKVYTGICPRGGRSRPLTINTGGGIHILRCQ